MGLVFTGFGMISALGWDALRACAAIRAGIARPRQLADFQVIEQEELDSVGVTGHPVRGFSEGFHLTARWRRLVSGCVSELRERGGLARPEQTAFWSRTGLIVATPYLSDGRYQTEDEANEERIHRVFVEPMREELQLATPIEHVGVVALGHASVAVALVRARDLISSGELDRLIVLAVDSYLDSLSINWLARYNRLKLDDNPTGLMPGEAAAAILVEARDVAAARGATSFMVLGGVAADRETNHFFQDNGANIGQGLARAALGALERRSARGPFAGQVIADHTGESWRAHELACAQIALRGKIDLDAVSSIFPATSLGDTGAASGAVALCYVASSFVRGYAIAAESLILSSSIHGDVGAIHLLAPSARGA